MKLNTRLDSAFFQLTPTRTRCDLVITANGKTEKIASGLLNPFLAHLKTAQDQIAKGGYSILLEPESGSDTSWFTKGTVERFVRFVSTPEILERVYTIESEILQIEEAIAIQGNNDTGLSIVEAHQAKPMGSSEGSKHVTSGNEEKAIVLYKPEVNPTEADGSILQEGNSKVQLLKVLETRKSVLQKEQGMAFARAVAAGFDIDHVAPLVSFAECFGASRLMDACLRFLDLWKRKHEMGQWVEIEAAEAMSNRSDLSAMNSSGIMLSSVANKQNELHGDLPSENNGKAGLDARTDERFPIDQQEYFQGQFSHPMYPPWSAHTGALPVFQPYPMQGVPYYQNYPGNVPFYQPPYPPVEDSRYNAVHRTGHKRHSMDSRDSNTESEAWEMDATKTWSHGDMELEKEVSRNQDPQKKAGRSGKKQSSVVVIRNINYISSKGQKPSGSESESASDSEIDEGAVDFQTSSPDVILKNSLSSKRKGRHENSKDELNSYDKKEYEKETDGGHWQAFQSFLLRDTDEHNRSADRDMFTSEENVRIKRQQDIVGNDPLAVVGHDPDEMQDRRMTELQVTGKVAPLLRESNDEDLMSRGKGHYRNGRGSKDNQMDTQFAEINRRKVVYRRNGSDDFIISGQENQSHFVSSSDPLVVTGYMHATNNIRQSSPPDATDESFMVPFRSMSQDQVGVNHRAAVDMDSELPSTVQKPENSYSKTGNQVDYEPNDLSVIPEHGTEKRTIGYDPTLEYETQVHIGDSSSVNGINKKAVADSKQVSKRSDKDQRSKVTPGALDKKKTVGPIRKGKPSKMSPLEDARARAERLRSFKADLQKMKKEKEEEEQKRLEALKLERQKRIAARGSSTAGQSLSSQQTRKQLPTKLSLTSHKGSKFSDSEPGSSSPLQRSKLRTASLGSNESHKTSKTSKSSNGSHLPGNRLTKSVSSLPEPRKESSGVTPDSKASMAHIRRLSEPKISSSPGVVPVKTRNAQLVSKSKGSNEPDSKKISAIMSLDKSKAATLPELRIRTSKGPSDVGRNKSAAKEMTNKTNGNKFSVTGSNSDKSTHQNEEDENPIIDKTVVMLECEKPSIPVVHESEESKGAQQEHYESNDKVEKIEMISGYAAIHAPPSPMDVVDTKPIQSQLQEQPVSSEVLTCQAEKELAESSSLSVARKPYQAPYARVSSLEDPCTENTDYVKAPSTSIEAVTKGVEMARAQVSGFQNLNLESIPEALEKPQVKDSTKGFRRLLKFGRKNHNSSGEQSIESDNAVGNGSEVDDPATNVASSNEVHTLKNLISQDETPTTGKTSKKSSRHFSLLSPFRSKTSEKKLTT